MRPSRFHSARDLGERGAKRTSVRERRLSPKIGCCGSAPARSDRVAPLLTAQVGANLLLDGVVEIRLDADVLARLV